MTRNVAIDVEGTDCCMNVRRLTEQSSNTSDQEKRDPKERKAEKLISLSVSVRRVVLVLAALEQAATYLAQIAFLGATVVLLGGYAPRLKLYDFALISALLLSEGVRVFLASRNVEYSKAKRLHLSNWGPGLCTWPCWISESCLSDKDKKEVKRGVIHAILQALQMGTAAVTFAFSLARLKSGNYKPTLSSPSDAEELANFVYGIRLFYILTLVESSVFLVVKAVAWDLLMLQIRCSEFGVLLASFALEVYEVFIREGFGKASATHVFTFIINGILEHPNETYKGALENLHWQIPEDAKTNESITCLIRLTAPGVPEEIRHCANKILAKVVLKGTSQKLLLAAPEFGRIPLEVVDLEVIEFLHRIVTDAPLGFLPPQAVSKQASEFLIKAIVEGDRKIQSYAAKVFFKWWSDPTIYRTYVFDPADIFYRLFIHRQQWVRPKDIVHHSELEEIFGYEGIADPIITVFAQQVEQPRSYIMNKLLSRVDFSKLKNKQSTVNLSGILPKVISATDYVIWLVAAWIWFMDESTFQKAICKLSEEEVGMLKNCAPIYEAILTSQKKECFQEKEHDTN